MRLTIVGVAKPRRKQRGTKLRIDQIIPHKRRGIEHEEIQAERDKVCALIRPFGKSPALPARLEKALPFRRKKKTIPLGAGSHGIEMKSYERVVKFSP